MQMTFTITGGVNVAITVTEQTDGSLRFDLEVLGDTGQIGDLNAVYFDMGLNVGTAGLAIAGDDVTGTAVKEAGVVKVSSYTTMSGEVINEYGKFDVGVQFGTAGIGNDDIRTTSFVLTSASGPLTLADVALQDFGVRLTSVGVEGGSRDGSLKLGGESPDGPDDPPPPDVHVANDDSITVLLGEDFFDYLDSGESSVLVNDTTNAGAYAGTVLGLDVNTPVATLVGTNGGTMEIFADGTVDFHAGSDFDHLAEGEQETTLFTYAIDGGDTATVTVNVFGFGGGVDFP